MKAKSLPPRPSSPAEGSHDDRTARRLLVQLDGRREDVERQRCPDTESGVAVVDRESAEQESRNGIGRALGYDSRCGRSVDPGHGNARVGHDHVVSVGDHPRGGRIASPVLAGVAAQPLIEHRLATVEPVAIVSARVKPRRPAQLSQAS